jgi:hypothetical protein
MHCAESFQVKNNGPTSVEVFFNIHPPVTVPPGETSRPFVAPGEYKILPNPTTLPLPRPEIIVIFSPGELFEAKAINSPSLNVDIIAQFDFIKGDLIPSLSPG